MTIDRRQFVAGAALSVLPIPLSAAVPRPLQIVSTNQRMPSGFLSLPATKLGFKHRTLHIIGAPTSEIVLGFCGWAVPSNIEIDAPLPYQYSKVAIEIGGQVVPVTFGGSRSVTISGGSPYVLADTIRPEAFGLTEFPRDMPFFVRAIGSVGAATKLPVGTFARGNGMLMAYFSGATAIDDIDSTGALTVVKGTTVWPSAPGPCLVLGRAPAGYLSVICTGDSIADGAGDGARLAVGNGFFNRAGVDDQGFNAISSLNLTKFGSTAGTVTKGLGVPGAPGFAYRQMLLGFGNVLVDQLGVNTLGGSRPNTADRVVGPARALWTLARTRGIQKVIRTTLTINAKSTNKFIDLQGQTPAINWGPGQARDDINAVFAAALASGEIDRLSDVLSPIADPTDLHRWASNGTNLYATSDGIHPSAASARGMATALRASYQGLVVS